nr:MAG TPA: lipoprotein [Caudoviricetes sp.]
MKKFIILIMGLISLSSCKSDKPLYEVESGKVLFKYIKLTDPKESTWQDSPKEYIIYLSTNHNKVKSISLSKEKFYLIHSGDSISKDSIFRNKKLLTSL